MLGSSYTFFIKSIWYLELTIISLRCDKGCFIVCFIVGNYSVSFFVPLLFSFLLNVHETLYSIPKFKWFLIIFQAVLSGLTSVLTFWMLKMSGIKLLFYSDVYTGLIIAILLNHLISYYSCQKSLVSEWRNWRHERWMKGF